jgi:hypothetical protein
MLYQESSLCGCTALISEDVAITAAGGCAQIVMSANKEAVIAEKEWSCR